MIVYVPIPVTVLCNLNYKFLRSSSAIGGCSDWPRVIRGFVSCQLQAALADIPWTRAQGFKHGLVSVKRVQLQLPVYRIQVTNIGECNIVSA